jgi:hypothetical protein
MGLKIRVKSAAEVPSLRKVPSNDESRQNPAPSVFLAFQGRRESRIMDSRIIEESSHSEKNDSAVHDSA